MMYTTPDERLENLGIESPTHERPVDCRFYIITAVYPILHKDGTINNNRSYVESGGAEFVVPLSVEEIEMIIDENTGTFSEHMLRELYGEFLELKRHIIEKEK